MSAIDISLNRRRVLAAGAVGLGSLFLPGLARKAGATEHDRWVPFVGAYNVRDIGGYAAAGGRTVAWNKVYRSSSLNHLDAGTAVQVSDLGVRVVADFRSISEVQDGGKDVLPAKVKGLNLPVGDAAPGTTSTAPAGPPPTEVSADLEAEFRTYVTALEARLSFGAALRTLLVPGVQPLLWHCNSGTFRTGWITAVLHTALGVSKADAYADFLLSNVAFGATYAFAEYLDAAFDEATKTFGSFSGYLRTGLGIDDRTRDRLKASLLA